MKTPWHFLSAVVPAIVCLTVLVASDTLVAADLSTWQRVPRGLSGEVTATSATLQSDRWGYLLAPSAERDIEISTVLTIDKAAATSSFFGESWSVWPDPTFGDGGFEAGLIVRANADATRGYRVQVSHSLQSLALVRFPDGGYVRSVACPIPLNQPIPLQVRVSGNVITVHVAERESLRYVDPLTPPLDAGQCGLATSSRATVRFTDTGQRVVAPEARRPEPHVPAFQVRSWIGNRPWLFDGDEPILLLPVPREKYINNAKLRPGLKPLLSWNSHWGIENQGAFPEGSNENSPISVAGGGQTITIAWTARQAQDRFETRTTMTVSFDTQRQVYVYDVDSLLKVLGSEPFQFRYGYDFEHHTPLDPFGWQYLMVRKRGGQLTYRPVAPFDPGPLEDVEPYHGLRVWHGRTHGDYWVSPAVEYQIAADRNRVADAQGVLRERSLNTAVCAAFYDTGVAFAPETARPGDQVHVRFRYTGYPADETTRLFESAQVQDNPRIDPNHHFVFAQDQWPRIRFQKALAMDRPWWGGRPFLSGHNARPSYDSMVMPDGQRVLRLGPVSYGVAPVGPDRIPAGQYRVTTRVKSTNIHGPGGRIEIFSLKKSDLAGNGYVPLDRANIVAHQIRYFGTGTHDWQERSFVFDQPADAAGLALGLGNAGTGELYVSQVEFQPGNDTSPNPELSSVPAPSAELPDCVWNLQMQEQQGLYVYNAGASGYRTLELANVDWVRDDGRPALRFAENPEDRNDYPKLGILDRWVRHPVHGKAYLPVRHGAFGLGGHHGGGEALPGVTLAAWIKPAAEMGKSAHQGKGDVVGYGARRFILGLHGQTAPYSVAARINVNDRFESAATLAADRWSHIAFTATPTDGHWLVRLFVNGEQVQEGRTQTFPATALVPDSLILGAELFYLHDAYYRGLIGPVQVYRRALSPNEILSHARDNVRK